MFTDWLTELSNTADLLKEMVGFFIFLEFQWKI